MTDPRRPDDDMVSAVLDGEATPAEKARVEADPELARRLAEFEAVRHTVGGPVEPVDATTRDRAIIRALGQVDGPTVDEPAPVTAIDRERTRRGSETSRRVLMAAAAVVAVLALGGGLLTLAGDDETDRATGTADEAAPAGGVTVPELDLGSIDDPETLRREINEATGLVDEAAPDAAAPLTSDSEGEAAFDEAPGAEADGAPGAGPVPVEDCAVGLIETRPQLIGQLAQGLVTYRDADAYVFVYNDAITGGAVGIVTAVADCAVLAEVPL